MTLKMRTRGQPDQDPFGLDTYASGENQNMLLPGLSMDADDGFGLSMDADDGFGLSFGSQAMSYSPSCPSSSGSFSPSSSLYEALTPPPRNATPQHPLEFDIAFGSDSLMYDDFAPSTPSGSGCLPFHMSSTVAPSMLCHGLPVTPSRSVSSAAALQSSVEFTPAQGMDTYGLLDSLMSTPSPLFGNQSQSYDVAALWQPPTSPIKFERTSPPSFVMAAPALSSLGTSPHGNTRRRVIMDGPQQRSASLQQSMPKASSGKSRTSKAKEAARKKPLQEGFKVSKSNQYRCDVPSCEGKCFLRPEHLQRHKKVKHFKVGNYICKFCFKSFSKGRPDNFLVHLRRHMTEGPRVRTKFSEDAAREVERMESLIKKKNRKGADKGVMSIRC